MDREYCIRQLNKTQTEIDRSHYRSEASPTYPNLTISERMELGYDTGDFSEEDWMDIDNFIKTKLKSASVSKIMLLKEKEVELRSRLKQIL